MPFSVQVLRSIWFYNVVYLLGVTIACIVLAVKLNRHECPKLTIPELKEKNIEKIKEIYNIESNDDLDSLLFELYNFGATR